MPYQAQRPSLFGNVGGSNPPTQPLDVGGAIEALTGGAASLIHATMLRKQAERANATQASELALRQQSEGFQQQRMLADEEYRKTQAANEKQKIEDAFTIAGGIRGKPGQPTMVPEASMESVGPLPAPVTPRGPIAQSMARGKMKPTDAGPLPQAGYTPSAPPTPAATNPLPANAKLKKGLTAATPDRVDLDQNVRYETSQGAAGIRANAARDVANINANGRLTVAGINNAAKVAHDNVSIHIAGIKAGGAAGKPMTPTQRIAAQRFVFDQIGKQSNGNPDDAAGILNGGDGALAKLAGEVGITEAEVRRAAAAFGTKANEATDKEVLGVFQSGMAPSVQAAKTAVTSAKTPPVKPGIKPAAAKPAPLGAEAKNRATNGKGDTAEARDADRKEFQAFLKSKGYDEAEWSGSKPTATLRRLTVEHKKVPADSGKK